VRDSIPFVVSLSFSQKASFHLTVLIYEFNDNDTIVKSISNSPIK
jgi:hypothetical protein